MTKLFSTIGLVLLLASVQLILVGCGSTQEVSANPDQQVNQAMDAHQRSVIAQHRKQ